MMGIVKSMRANLIWFIPLAVAGLFIAFQNIMSGYYNVVLYFDRLSWGAFFLSAFSPSVYLFFSASFTSAILPLFVLGIPAFFDQSNQNLYRRRYLFSIGLVLSIIILGFILEVLIWGSFPLNVGKDGYIHLRLIPFFPWPETPLFG